MVHFVASPPEEQEDHAQHGKLLQHAGADGQHRRSSDVVVVEDRVPERDDIEDSSGYERRVKDWRVRVVQLALRAQRHDDQGDRTGDDTCPGRTKAPKVSVPLMKGRHGQDDPKEHERRHQDRDDLEYGRAIHAWRSRPPYDTKSTCALARNSLLGVPPTLLARADEVVE